MCQLADRISTQRDSLISDMPKPSDNCGVFAPYGSITGQNSALDRLVVFQPATKLT